MKKINSIIAGAAEARTHLEGDLGADAASVALALALGRLCAESGLSLADCTALVELTHREALAEKERTGGHQVAA